VTPAREAPLRFAVVGGGLISDTHARALGGVEGATLAAFVGGTRSRQRADRFGVPHHTDLAEAVARSGVQAAVICTPTGTHAKLGIAAARLGLHVVVEKPIDASVGAARRLRDACRRAGVTLGVISQRRFDAGFVELAGLLRGGRLGRLTLGSAAMKCWRDDDYYRAGWQGADLLGGGGALINQGIHVVDMLLSAMGPAERVTAVCRSLAHDIEVEDVALASVEFANGAVGTIEATTAFYSAVSGPTVANAVERLEVAGTTGSAILSGGRLVHCSVPSGDLPVSATLPAATSALPLDPFRLQHQDFVDAVLAGREPAVTGADGLRALALVSAIYESARAGKPVDLDQEGD
jgi:predicted dehydrogenase